MLQQRKTQLLNLQPRWENPLASQGRFDSHVSAAIDLARTLTTKSHQPAPPVVWLPPVVILDLDDENQDDDHDHRVGATLGAARNDHEDNQLTTTPALHTAYEEEDDVVMILDILEETDIPGHPPGTETINVPDVPIIWAVSVRVHIHIVSIDSSPFSLMSHKTRVSLIAFDSRHSVFLDPCRPVCYTIPAAVSSLHRENSTFWRLGTLYSTTYASTALQPCYSISSPCLHIRTSIPVGDVQFSTHTTCP